MAQRIAPAERLAIVVFVFTVWTFLFTAASGSAAGFPDPNIPGEVGRFRIVYDVLWLTSLAVFVLLGDAAFGSDGPWLRSIRGIALAGAVLGATLIPVLVLVLLAA